MISYVKGTLEECFDDCVVVDNNGIGLGIRVPFNVIDNLPACGEEVKLFTYLYVREDAMNLFGFLSRDDLQIFKLLINVSGIGPKGALGIMSSITSDELRFAVLAEDVKKISQAPGVGAKTAKRLIIELKDKLNLEETFESALSKNIEVSSDKNASNDVGIAARNDACAALVALGYSNTEALRAVRKVENIESKDSDTILKEALKYML